MKNDIVATLAADHVLLAKLGRELRSCPHLDKAQVLLRQFSRALGGHLSAFRKVVHPALRSAGWKDVPSDLLVGHAKLTHAFADLLTINPQSASFAEHLGDLLDAMDQLLERERAELLPLLEANLDESERIGLSMDVDPYLVSSDEDDVALASRWPLSEMMDEARLLLGGLAALYPAADGKAAASR